MRRKLLLFPAIFLVITVCSAPLFSMAQTNQSDAERWLAKAQLAPPFQFPDSKTAWEKKREQVRSQLWQLLGKLPPRPRSLKVQTVSKEDRGDYLLEKFELDNLAGATV